MKNEKTYEGKILFIEPNSFEPTKQVIFEEGNIRRIKFDYETRKIRYTVDIGEKGNGYWVGKYSYWDQGKLIEETLDNCEVFKRTDGSYLIYGWWIEDRTRWIFCVEFDEA